MFLRAVFIIRSLRHDLLNKLLRATVNLFYLTVFIGLMNKKSVLIAIALAMVVKELQLIVLIV